MVRHAAFAFRGGAGAMIVGLLLGAGGGGACASPPKAAAAASSPTGRPAATVPVTQEPTWQSLKPAQREALKPLEREWATMDSLRKRKWLEVADRYPAMPSQDQARLQSRMAEWAKLTPRERDQTRLYYQEAKKLPAQEREASWEAYQALPAEQRRQLADRAAPVSKSASRPEPAAARLAPVSPSGVLALERPQPKSNTVPNPALAAPPKSVAPSVIQARPGATTTLITKQPTPPAHQQSGMPKIAATPEFVDRTTLLPQVGAQSAGARPKAASASAASR